jgi:probable biosynthetic protein (TIGR04098 family)
MIALAATPARRLAAESGRDEMRLGMPQLALGGLSEGWLLRECGSRHWTAVADCFRVPPQRLEDRRGHRLYASFLAVRIHGDPLGAFAEGDGVGIETHLTRLSRHRFFSRHRVASDGAALSVEMITALLKRERSGDNTSLSEPEEPASQAPPASGPADSDLPERDKAVRAARRGRAPDAATFRYRYRPVPQADFNGAGLLYFASYPVIVDRAEWEWRPAEDALALTTSRREVFFFGNVNPGDQVEVAVHDVHAAGELRHRADLFRVSDGRRIAEVSTVKRSAR